jgi:hypothetical protein
MLIVHSGIGPRCLSPLLFNSLVKSPDNVVVSVDDVDDLELRFSLVELISVESVEVAHSVIDKRKLDRILELPGAFRFLRDVDDVKKVAAETAHWYVLGRMRPAFESFKKGLNHLGLLDAIINNSLSFRSVMCFNTQVLTSATIAALESEVGIRQCRPKCRPINLQGQQIFADLNSAKVRTFFGVKKSTII